MGHKEWLKKSLSEGQYTLSVLSQAASEDKAFPARCPALFQMSGSQPQMGRGVPCLRCRGLCTGFEPHSWR